eukprot:jgi/Phyca11/102488/e_gw1.6.1062.1
MDQPTGDLTLRRQVIEDLCARLKCKQIFSPTYSPWINGSVERVNRDILQVLRASLNHTAVPSLANRTPSELFTGLEPPSPLQAQTLLNKKKERGDNIVNFNVGDYVLRSRVDEKRQTKLLVTWIGPYSVITAE